MNPVSLGCTVYNIMTGVQGEQRHDAHRHSFKAQKSLPSYNELYSQPLYFSVDAPEHEKLVCICTGICFIYVYININICMREGGKELLCGYDNVINSYLQLLKRSKSCGGPEDMKQSG